MVTQSNGIALVSFFIGAVAACGALFTLLEIGTLAGFAMGCDAIHAVPATCIR